MTPIEVFLCGRGKKQLKYVTFSLSFPYAKGELHQQNQTIQLIKIKGRGEISGGDSVLSQILFLHHPPPHTYTQTILFHGFFFSRK